MRDFDDVDPSTTSEEAMLLFLLGLVLGVLSIRMKHRQQTEQLVEVTKDFKTFQATFMSEHVFRGCIQRKICTSNKNKRM